jgi:hypothetical protein
VLGHTLYFKAIDRGKVKNEKVDSENLGYLLRTRKLPVSFAYPNTWRSTRDPLPRRMHLVRQRV